MIEYEQLLNEAQRAAVTSTAPAILVVAGAGSGKTRTIVFRLAWLLEHGVAPESILLLTFTRKAAKEMIHRANELLETEAGVQGGTFHAFAYRTLKYWPPEWLEGRRFTLMDQSESLQALQDCKRALNLGGRDRSFPKVATIQTLLSKARNKEEPLESIVEQEAYQLLGYVGDIQKIGKEYTAYCRERALMDYDDLLFELEHLLRTNPSAQESLHRHFSHIMVDEYQDTNPVQARIVRLLATPEPDQPPINVMVVGDEAQSIYAFRGSTIRNILDFPKLFPNTEVICLEENYRSTEAILDVANAVLRNADESFKKVLFTRNKSQIPVFHYQPKDEKTQASLVIQEILDLRTKYPAEEIAVLFRSSYHSYSVEAGLNHYGIPFRKFGGLKYTEAAHIKDCIAFARMIANPTDIIAFSRIAAMHPGVGPKTIDRLYGFLREGKTDAFTQAIQRFSGLAEDLTFIERSRASDAPGSILKEIVNHFEPKLQVRYADDWPSRKPSLEELALVAEGYASLDDFLADLVLDPNKDDEYDKQGKIVLSTIHSAKGLEWDAVLLIDLVTARFPTHYAVQHPKDYEEERRLMYVACTRARKELHLYSPKNIFNRFEGETPADVSPFIQDITRESRKLLVKMGSQTSAHYEAVHSEPRESGKKYCHHAIFGDGEIVAELDGDICQVRFPNYGEKTLLKSYLEIDE